MSISNLSVRNINKIYADTIEVNTLESVNIVTTNVETVNLTATNIETTNLTTTNLTATDIQTVTETVSGDLTAGALITNTIKSKPGNTLNIQTTGNDAVKIGSATNDVTIGDASGGIVRIKGVAYPAQQHYGSLYWTLASGVVASNAVIPWNYNSVGGGVTFDGDQLIIDDVANGYYLVHYGYSNVQISGSGGNHPQSFSLKINGTLNDRYTLQELWNNVPASATDLSNNGQSSVAIVNLFANSTITMVNSLTSSVGFENKVSANAIGGITSVNAYLVIMRMF